MPLSGTFMTLRSGFVLSASASPAVSIGRRL
jgi:hypothetical protein